MQTIKKKRINRRTKKQRPQRKIKSQLYPPLKPLSNIRITVDKIHTLNVETYGTIGAKPVLYVHGGPGSGINPDMARFFNPKKYFIILVDQRGSGKSTPAGELYGNTTSNLISDFEKIRKHFKLDKWMVYGGSWGSTLSLAYAIKHPERTTELVLRGVFFCSDRENEWVSEPNGAQRLRPDAWNYYTSSLPKTFSDGIGKEGALFSKKYASCFVNGTKKEQEQCLLAWGVWEDSISTLTPIELKKVITSVKLGRFKQMSKIENKYFLENCFLPKNYFLKKKNLEKLRKIPTTIVQGMYDLVTPFETAHALHKALPHSLFFPTMAGHSTMEKENIRYLVQSTDFYANKD
jgi:proline iminopeptidase